MFKITDAKGFHITFDNGWTVSVQFGAGNYCDNYDSPEYDKPAKPSTTAEVAAWDINHKWYEFETDMVKGYCTSKEVLEFMNLIAAL